MILNVNYQVVPNLLFNLVINLYIILLNINYHFSKIIKILNLKIVAVQKSYSKLHQNLINLVIMPLLLISKVPKNQ